MHTSKRFESAIKKLYLAFHNNTLNPEDCKQCAVGNILNNTDTWQYFTDQHGSTKLNYVGLVNEKFGRRFGGYSPLELLKVEAIFLKACGYKGLNKKRLYRPENIKDKQLLFKGLEAVITYLCQLDHIQNVMDYTKLFEYRPQRSIQRLEIA